MEVHQIKISFNVTDEIKRYVYVYILESQYCYLIDAGVSGSETIIENYLKSIGRTVTDIRGIFLTHAHPDHIGTAAYFQEKAKCNIYASEGEKRWIEDIDLEFKERPIPNFYSLVGRSAKVNQIVKDGDRVVLEENLEVQVLGTPGHSSDQVSYIIDDNAFIGDSVLVKGDIPIYINKEKTIESLKRLSELRNVVMFYPAWDTKYTKEMASVKISEARELIDLLDELVKLVYKDIPKGDLSDICKAVCQKIGMLYLIKNPLFAQTVKSHIQDRMI